MSKPNKKKIDTNPSQQGLNAAFANAFGAFDSAGLPAGPEIPAAAGTEPERPAKLGRVLLRKEKAHRAGKAVIVAYDFGPGISDEFLEGLAMRLRKTCGCGGTVRDREIELQGDQPARIREALEREGFRVGGI